MPQSHQEHVLEVALPGHCGPSLFAGLGSRRPGCGQPCRAPIAPGGDNLGPRAAGSRQSIPLQRSASLQPGRPSSALPDPQHLPIFTLLAAVFTRLN